MKNPSMLLLLILALGCKQMSTTSIAPPTTSSENPVAPQAAAPTKAADVPLPSFQVTHQESGLATIVVDRETTDAGLKRLIWQLRTAAHDRTFNEMKISQSLVNERDPTFYIQIYKGPRCSEENRSKGAKPCGLVMHNAASYLLGSFASRDSEAADLYHGDGETLTEVLFGPGQPPPLTLSELVQTKRPIEGESEQLSKPAAVIQQFNESVWAGGRKAVFGIGSKPSELDATADWLASSDNQKLMQSGLKSRKADACSAGFAIVRIRAFASDQGTVLNLNCQHSSK